MNESDCWARFRAALAQIVVNIAERKAREAVAA
jgi:hypothetical protein